MKKTGKVILAALITSSALLAACSSKDTKDSSGKAADVQTILVGTGTQFPNICFIDDKGKLTGYDVELMRAIDEKLPEYKFEFKTMDFSNLLMSLETKKIDIVAHQMEANKEREKKFLFNKEPYNIFPLQVTVNKNNNSIHSIEDLKGKKIGVAATSSAAALVNDYNKNKGLGAEVLYTTNSADTIERLKTGRLDAILNTPFSVNFVNKQADAQQKVVGKPLLSSKTYFVFNKDESKLADRIDEALKELKKDGTVSKLSKHWLGDDYSVNF